MSKSPSLGALFEDSNQLKTPPKTSMVVLVQIAFIAGLLLGLADSGCAWLGWPWGLSLPLGLVVLVFGVPWSRRKAVGWFWCELTRVRIRRALWEARVCTRQGRLPIVLSVRSTEVGERVRLWMRPGTALEQLGREDDRNVKLGIIRAALVAREVRVSRSARWAQLVTVEVARRDRLAASSVVTSPLAGEPARSSRFGRGRPAQTGVK